MLRRVDRLWTPKLSDFGSGRNLDFGLRAWGSSEVSRQEIVGLAELHIDAVIIIASRHHRELWGKGDLAPTILLYYYTTILLYYYTTILLYYYTTILLYYYTTILLYYYTTILLYYYTILLLYYYCTTTILLLYYYYTTKLQIPRGALAGGRPVRGSWDRALRESNSSLGLPL